MLNLFKKKFFASNAIFVKELKNQKQTVFLLYPCAKSVS